MASGSEVASDGLGAALRLTGPNPPRLALLTFEHL
jgi:hypothetical protein